MDRGPVQSPNHNFHQYRDYITLYLCRFREVSADDRDDVAQQAILNATKDFHKFKGTCKPRTWLVRIAVNIVFDHLRKQKRRGTTYIEDMVGGENKAFEIPEDPRVLDQIQAKVDATKLVAAIKTLPKYMQATVLMIGNGLSYEEIASKHDVALGTVKSRLNRARTILAAMLPDMADASYGQ